MGNGQGEEQHAKGLKCAEVGRHRSWYEEDSRRRATRNDAATREFRRKRVKRVSSLPVGATVPRKERWGRRHIYLTCDATAPEFH